MSHFCSIFYFFLFLFLICPGFQILSILPPILALFPNLFLCTCICTLSGVDIASASEDNDFIGNTSDSRTVESDQSDLLSDSSCDNLINSDQIYTMYILKILFLTHLFALQRASKFGHYYYSF